MDSFQIKCSYFIILNCIVLHRLNPCFEDKVMSDSGTVTIRSVTRRIRANGGKSISVLRVLDKICCNNFPLKWCIKNSISCGPSHSFCSVSFNILGNTDYFLHNLLSVGFILKIEHPKPRRKRFQLLIA